MLIDINKPLNSKSDSDTSDLDQEIDSLLDNSLTPTAIDNTQEIINGIIEAPTKDDLQMQFDLFNMNLSKKNALRIIKLQSLLNKVEDQAIERFEKRPDQVSNKELLDYMQVVSAQIDRSQKSVDSLRDRPTIKEIKNNTEVNINLTANALDKDSKERVMDAIQGLLKQIQAPALEIQSQEPIQAEIVKDPLLEAVVINDDLDYDSDDIVYNNENTKKDTI